MDNQNKIKGLGGWLILVGVGVVLAPIQLVVTYVPMYLPLLSRGTWAAITSVSSETYHPLLGPLLVGEIVFNTSVFAVSLYLIYLFFAKHRLFPKVYITIVIVTLIFIPLDAWLGSFIFPNEPFFDADTTKKFARAIGGALVWVPYLLVSKRVKATFVEKMPKGNAGIRSANDR